MDESILEVSFTDSTHRYTIKFEGKVPSDGVVGAVMNLVREVGDAQLYLFMDVMQLLRYKCTVEGSNEY